MDSDEVTFTFALRNFARDIKLFQEEYTQSGVKRKGGRFPSTFFTQICRVDFSASSVSCVATLLEVENGFLLKNIHFHEEGDRMKQMIKLKQKKKKVGGIKWIKSLLPKTDPPLFINQDILQ